MSKKRKIKGGLRLKKEGGWVKIPAQLLYVLKDLSLSARRILDTLEIEHCRHGGRDNGQLPCTYSDFERYVQRKAVRPALDELIAAGLIDITRIGRRAYADLPRTCSLYRLTYLRTFRDGKWVEPTHEWKKPGVKSPLGQVAKSPPETPKASGNSTTAPPSEPVANPPHLSRDLGEVGGGAMAGSKPPIVSHAPSEGIELRAALSPPSITAPSSGRVH